MKGLSNVFKNMRQSWLRTASLCVLLTGFGITPIVAGSPKPPEEGEAEAAITNLRGKVRFIQDMPFLHRTGPKEGRFVYLNGIEFSNADLVWLDALPNIRSISVRIPREGSHLTGAWLARLASLPELQELDLRGCESVPHLKELEGAKQLGTLGLNSVRLSDTDLANVGRLKQLQRLDLARTGITDAGLASLAGLKNLQELNLHQTRVTNDGLANLKSLMQLQRLDLSNTRITDAGLENLKGLDNLKQLNLQGTWITDTGLEHLKDLKNLEALDLSDISEASWSRSNKRITNAGVAQLQGMKQLRYLGLNNVSSIDDAGLTQLKDLTQLRRLDLSNASITDSGMEILQRFSELGWLDLRANSMTSAGLAHLKGLKRLEMLCVAANRRIDDDAIEHLVGLGQLRQVIVSDTRVTDEGGEKLRFARLRAKLPRCLIFNRCVIPAYSADLRPFVN